MQTQRRSVICCHERDYYVYRWGMNLYSVYDAEFFKDRARPMLPRELFVCAANSPKEAIGEYAKNDVSS